MTLTRRDLLRQSTTAILTLGLPQRAFSQIASFSLEAMVANVQLAPESYPKTEIWGYGGKMPGPEIRVSQGERVTLELKNGLPQPTSVHWHGIRIDNRMDGVAGLTQAAVAPSETFTYDFVAPDAGTYWYHAHNRSVEQVGRGLYGALIVEEPVAPDIDRDETLILDDWLLNPETAQIDPDFSSHRDRSHAGRRGNFSATNGIYDLNLPVKKGERLRLRLINAANARIFVLGLAGFRGWIVALDGMPLSQPEEVSEQLILAPGQRIDLFVDVVAEIGQAANLVKFEDKDTFSQVGFPVIGESTKASRGIPAPLPPNSGHRLPDLSSARKLRLNMEGGAMGGLTAAILKGERKEFSQLVEENQFWAFNGVIGMTDVPLANISAGQVVRLEIVNDTSFPHAMHLHGMHFREVLDDGGFGPMRDTLLSFGGQTREIAFLADNPGDWLFHCHMLSHAASGMMTWMRVNS